MLPIDPNFLTEREEHRRRQRAHHAYMDGVRRRREHQEASAAALVAATTQPVAERQAQVLQHVTSDPGCTSNDISDHLGISRRVANETLATLLLRGRVRRAQHPDGRRYQWWPT